jgi:2-desacetyl-2-hydroxyethyl bacteriochlorophyllide A dehydrogenase
MGQDELISIYFTGPREVQVRHELPLVPAPGGVLVQTLLSAISSGTEMLVYRDQFPADLAVDENLSSLAGAFHYPLRYGYAAVGQVAAIGAGVDPAWEGRLVFGFQPHTSHFLSSIDDLAPVPEGISAEQAIFLPNMETAVNFVMDGAPLIGEQVAVFGQGIVGLLTAALLRRFPLCRLVTIDRYHLRRTASLDLGVSASLEPLSEDLAQDFKTLLPGGADLTYELSGAPQALDQAIALTGFNGRVVIGSWYGQKRANLDLGGHFHRSRIRLISSQVSTLAPELSGRWNKARRFDLAWEMIRQVSPERWITHRFPIDLAPQAYQLLDRRPEETIQVVFTY